MSVAPPMPPARVEGEGIVLRPWVVADAPALSAAVVESRAELAEWLPWAGGDLSIPAYRTTIRAFAQAWRDRRDYVYGIFAADGAVLGGSGYHLRRGADAYEIGYWVRTSCTGAGVATRATRALTDAAFRQPGVERVAIAVDVENARSARVPERLGFTLTETYPAARDTTRASGWHHLFVVTRGDWVGRRDGTGAGVA